MPLISLTSIVREPFQIEKVSYECRPARTDTRNFCSDAVLRAVITSFDEWQNATAAGGRDPGGLSAISDESIFQVGEEG